MSISRATFLTAIVAASLVTTAVRADDLAATVANKLRESGAMKGYRVNVKAKSGTVWLEGTVSDPRQIEAAIAAAENTTGVERVVNRLSFGEQAAPSAGDSFSLPSSIRSLVGLPAAAAQPTESTPAELALAAEESAAIQLAQAVVESKLVRGLLLRKNRKSATAPRRGADRGRLGRRPPDPCSQPGRPDGRRRSAPARGSRWACRFQPNTRIK